MTTKPETADDEIIAMRVCLLTFMEITTGISVSCE